jgi:arylsulfatase A-like enzyme
LKIIPEDATVVVMADHGEELHHGFIGHARLYDECVRVPIFYRNGPDELSSATIRQIDLFPTLLDWLGLPVPNQWTGEITNGEYRASPLLNYSPLLEETHAGIRTEDHKYIRVQDEKGTYRRELYDLNSDPRETRDISKNSSLVGELDAYVEDHLKRVDQDLLQTKKTGLEGSVQERLQNLGYK